MVNPDQGLKASNETTGSNAVLEHLLRLSAVVQRSSNWQVFLLVFFANFFVSHPVAGGGSNGNVEQWLNLTNLMFEGKGDFLFSYGPLYWLTGGSATPYNLWTWLSSIIFTSAIQGIYWLLIWRLRRFNSWPQMIIAFGVIIASQGLMPSSASYMWPILLVPFLSDLKIFSPKSLSYLPFVLGAYVGMAFYVRFFFGLMAAVALLGWFVIETLKRRKYKPVCHFLVAMITAFLIFGLAIFHDRDSIAKYLIFNSQLSFGNAVDMTYEVETSWAVVACFAVLFGLVLWRLRRNAELLIPLLAIEVILFKLGFGRADHVATYLIPTAPLLLLLAGSGLGARRRIRNLVPLALLAFVSLVPNYVGAYSLQVVKDFALLQTPYASRMESLYPRFGLDKPAKEKIGSATVDIFPYYNEVAYANGLNYTPRPSFQSYMTLTPVLGNANDEFFNSIKAPRFVIWTAGATCPSPDCSLFDAFDGKYVLNEDPITSRAILANYQQVGKGNLASGLPFVLLEKNDLSDSRGKVGVSSKFVGELGKWIEVPDVAASHLRLSPELEFTTIANIKNTLFRGNVAKITYKLIDGSEKTHRLNIINSQSGIWASPYLAGTDFEGLKVTAVRIDSANWYIKQGFNYTWMTTSQ